MASKPGSSLEEILTRQAEVTSEAYKIQAEIDRKEAEKREKARHE